MSETDADDTTETETEIDDRLIDAVESALDDHDHGCVEAYANGEEGAEGHLVRAVFACIAGRHGQDSEFWHETESEDVVEAIHEVYPETAPEDGADIRAAITEELAEGHAAFGAVVRFPREDNDLDEIDSSTFLFVDPDEDMTFTEKLAAHTLFADAATEHAERISNRDPSEVVGEGDGGSGGPQAIAMPANLGDLMGAMTGGSGGSSAGDDDLDTGAGFQ